MRRAALSLIACAAAFVLGSRGARAAPSVWAVARDPALADREAVIGQVDGFFDKWRDSHDAGGPLGLMYLVHARELLEAADAERSPDWRLRLRLADALERLTQGHGPVSVDGKRMLERAVALYASVANSEATPPPSREDAWSDLGIAYAHLERPADEIRAYDHALALETETSGRALLLANRAEAEMVLGDLTAAVSGYRAALSEMATAPPLMVMSYAPTTLWGLAVALDRAGDLNTGLDTIALARNYDPGDRGISSSGWFYVPDYDEAWYRALGFWSAARHAQLDAVRAESYGLSVANWDDYLARAKRDDPWLGIAKTHRDACAKERDAFERKIRGAQPPRVEPRKKDTRTRQERLDAMKPDVRDPDAAEIEAIRKQAEEAAKKKQAEKAAKKPRLPAP